MGEVAQTCFHNFLMPELHIEGGESPSGLFVTEQLEQNEQQQVYWYTGVKVYRYTGIPPHPPKSESESVKTFMMAIHLYTYMR